MSQIIDVNRVISVQIGGEEWDITPGSFTIDYLNIAGGPLWYKFRSFDGDRLYYGPIETIQMIQIFEKSPI